MHRTGQEDNRVRTMLAFWLLRVLIRNTKTRIVRLWITSSCHTGRWMTSDVFNLRLHWSLRQIIFDAWLWSTIGYNVLCEFQPRGTLPAVPAETFWFEWMNDELNVWCWEGFWPNSVIINLLPYYWLYCSWKCVLLFRRRLGVELGKSVVFQESNRGEENVIGYPKINT